MVGEFNTIYFNERMFNETDLKEVKKTEKVLNGDGRKVVLMSGKFTALIKAVIKSPIFKFRVNDND